MTRNVITNVQILRFVAAASVLTHHCADLFLPQTSSVQSIPWSGGVDLFFVISGFIMAWLTRDCFGKPAAAGRFFLRRMIRIVPPYWFFTTVAIAALLFAPAYFRNTRLGATQIVTSYVFIPWPRPGDGQLSPLLSQGWTLNYEMFFYVCLAAALCFPRGQRWLSLLFVSLAVLHFLVPLQIFVLRFYSEPIILEFLGGIFLERIYHSGVRLSLGGSLACGVLAVLSFMVLRLLPFHESDRALRLGVAAGLMAAAFILAPEPSNPGPVQRALSAGGDASYTLYLAHPFSANAVALAWAASGFRPAWAGMAMAMMVSIAAAMIVYRTVERPVTKALQRAFGLRAAREPAVREAQMVAP